MANQTNTVIITGRLAADPEEIKLKGKKWNGARFTIVNNRKMKESEETNFIRCVVWGSTADYATEYLLKGSKVTVTGRLKTSKWEDKNGKEQSSMDVVVDQIESHGNSSSKAESNNASKSSYKKPSRKEPDEEEQGDEDVDEF